MSGGKPEVSEFDSVDPAPPSDDRNVARLRVTTVSYTHLTLPTMCVV